MNCHLSRRKLVAFGLAVFSMSVASVNAQGPMPQASAEHKGLEHEVGTWDADSKFWMMPGIEPVSVKAVEVNKMLGSMWMISEYKSEFMGQPFVGHGQFGYDPAKKKYVGTWVDSMNPHMSVMEGTKDKSGKVLTLMSTGIDPMTGKEEVSKMVSTMIDANHKKFEAFGQVPGKAGEWWKKMEINYTRRK